MLKLYCVILGITNGSYYYTDDQHLIAETDEEAWTKANDYINRQNGKNRHIKVESVSEISSVDGHRIVVQE